MDDQTNHRHPSQRKRMAHLRTEGDPKSETIVLYVENFPRLLRDQVAIIQIISKSVPVYGKMNLTMTQAMALVVEKGLSEVGGFLREQREAVIVLDYLKLPMDLLKK